MLGRAAFRNHPGSHPVVQRHFQFFTKDDYPEAAGILVPPLCKAQMELQALRLSAIGDGLPRLSRLRVRPVFSFAASKDNLERSRLLRRFSSCCCFVPLGNSTPEEAATLIRRAALFPQVHAMHVPSARTRAPFRVQVLLLPDRGLQAKPVQTPAPQY